MGCAVRVGAPQWIAVQGLRRCGYRTDADRISGHFLSIVARERRKHGDSSGRKYDVVNQTDNVAGALRYGYQSNEAGFGTNAVFTALIHQLPSDHQREILKSQ
jgi:alpha,alpha-trehalase